MSWIQFPMKAFGFIAQTCWCFKVDEFSSPFFSREVKININIKLSKLAARKTYSLCWTSNWKNTIERLQRGNRNIIVWKMFARGVLIAKRKKFLHVWFHKFPCFAQASHGIVQYEHRKFSTKKIIQQISLHNSELFMSFLAGRLHVDVLLCSLFSIKFFFPENGKSITHSTCFIHLSSFLLTLRNDWYELKCLGYFAFSPFWNVFITRFECCVILCLNDYSFSVNII